MKKLNMFVATIGALSMLGGVAYGQMSTGNPDAKPDSTMGKGAGTGTPGESTKPHDKKTDLTGGQTGVPEEYSTTPVRQGKLIDKPDSEWLNKTVQNQKGEELGKITKILVDKQTNNIEYAMLNIADSKSAVPMPWARFKTSGDKITLNATKEELKPEVSQTMSKDMSPDLSEYMDDVNRAREAPKAGGSGLGVTNQPASAGSMGEEKVGGGGPSGTRALPPQGQAPGLEGSNPSSKR